MAEEITCIDQLVLYLQAIQDDLHRLDLLSNILGELLIQLRIILTHFYLLQSEMVFSGHNHTHINVGPTSYLSVYAQD